MEYSPGLLKNLAEEIFFCSRNYPFLKKTNRLFILKEKFN